MGRVLLWFLAFGLVRLIILYLLLSLACSFTPLLYGGIILLQIEFSIHQVVELSEHYLGPTLEEGFDLVIF